MVDDEENQRQITSSILKRLGYKPFTVATGEMAMEYVQREPVDLLLLDMIMEPGISGYETLPPDLEFQPGQKAVIASGYFNPEDQDKIRALGISQYLTKPFSITVWPRQSRWRSGVERQENLGMTEPEITKETIDLGKPEWYLNRELTWLEFNRRVLREGQDPQTPLLERVFPGGSRLKSR